MGFLENAKKSLTRAVDQHGDKIEKGADSLGRVINDRTGHKHADKIAQGKTRLKKGLDSLDGKNDDFDMR
ncbi:MAG: antitoxin [Nocardioidaceae bacterium]